jgi:hypothetical protein
MYDIETIDGLISALGGDTAVANDLGISQPAVANWKVRGEIPGGWHMRLFAKVIELELAMDLQAVFGLTKAEAAALNQVASPTSRRAGNAPAVAA